KSRFDVMLGAKQLGDADLTVGGTKVNDSSLSYQIVTRFGRDLGAFDLMFKLGGHYWNTDREVGATKVEASGLDFLYGVGLDAWLTDSVRLGLDYTRYDMQDSDKGYDSVIDAADLNLSIMFCSDTVQKETAAGFTRGRFFMPVVSDLAVPQPLPQPPQPFVKCPLTFQCRPRFQSPVRIRAVHLHGRRGQRR